METNKDFFTFNVSNPIDEYIKPLNIPPLTISKPEKEPTIIPFTAICILASGIIYLYLQEK
jgi:hypothetical protein